jgi:type I restriction enzyme M protein
MDISTLENWLWEAACAILGPLDAPKFKDYILPLLFYKRLCDVFDDELDRLINELGLDSLKEARMFADMDRTLIRFYIPGEYTWAEIRKSSQELGQRLTDASPTSCRPPMPKSPPNRIAKRLCKPFSTASCRR